MSTLFPPPVVRPDGIATRRWTAEEYLRLAELGFFNNQRVELVDGEIFQMSPMNNPHAAALTHLFLILANALPKDQYWVRMQMTLALGENYPEPDIAVVNGPITSEGLIPNSAGLVVEVSDATLPLDRGRKSSLYASAGIPEYWIVNLVDREIEVRRSPVVDAKAIFGFRYADVAVVVKGGRMSSLIAPNVSIEWSKLFC